MGGMGESRGGPHCWLLGASERAALFPFPTKAAEGASMSRLRGQSSQSSNRHP